MVLIKKWPFFHVFFLRNIGQENVFYNILERKNAFVAHKKRGSKSRKIEIFPKGLTHGFGQKMAIFRCLFFLQYRPGKCVLQFSRTKKRLSSLWKQQVQKVEKLRFFPEGLTHGFGEKMAIFPFIFRQYRAGRCVLQ